MFSPDEKIPARVYKYDNWLISPDNFFLNR